MPQMANLTVKKADGTTDIVFTAQQPAAGDGNPAIWKCETVGTVLAGRPTLTLTARSNGTNKARRLTMSSLFPKVRVDVAGNPVVAGGLSGDATFLVPQDMLASEIAEFVVQFTNAMVQTLVRDSIKTGYAPS